MIQDEKLYLSINRKLIDKDTESIGGCNKFFEPKVVTRGEFAGFIDEGFAYSSQFKNNERKKDNFSRSSIIAIDFDGGKPLEDVKNDRFVQEHSAIIHTTPSHRKNGDDRFRLIFVLKEPISSLQEYESLTQMILNYFPEADPACKDGSRFFFGCQDSIEEIYEGYLDDRALHFLEPLFKKSNITIEKRKAKTIKDSSKNSAISQDEARLMLSYIDPQPGYHKWRDICFAVANEFGDAGKKLIQEWSPDDKGGKVIDRLFAEANGQITIGTLVYEATREGYQKQRNLKELYDKKNIYTSGQIALRQIFNNGKDYFFYGSELHLYKNGYGNMINNHEAEKTIAEFFDSYITGVDKEGRLLHQYASASHVKEALSYVKMNRFIDPVKLNPRGINLNNGYLRLNYTLDKTGKQQPSFELIDHSSEHHFDTIADFDYDPNVDCSLFDQALEDMLPEAEATALMRVLAASLDLPTIRKLHGRSIKLLFLYGDGSNGKDTLRTWLELLYGNKGVTHISVGSFKQADKSSNSVYELFNLVGSKVNWSSETPSVLIDQCETLKKFCTGDPISVRQIYEKPVTTIPKAIGLFNINGTPNLQTSSAAMDSRIGIIHFKNIFSTNPKKGQKLADPRLKEDLDYIRKNIMPAFLNRLIEAFYDLYQEGVDYSFNEDFMDAVREENNHFIQFIAEAGVVNCDVSEGVTVSYLYEIYLLWCITYGILEYDSFGNKKWVDPSYFDKPIKNVRQLGKKLNEHFPELQERRGLKRIKSLKVTNDDIYFEMLKTLDGEVRYKLFPLLKNKFFDSQKYS